MLKPASPSLTENKKENRACALFSFGVFAFFVAFYVFVHPAVLLDADDWTYISCSRAALPSTKFFNPCRILPEVLMPLCGDLAAWVLEPLTGSYMRSVTVMCALFISAFTALYAHEFLGLLRRKFSASAFSACLLTAVFLTLHFLVLRSQQEYNTHLFWSYSVTGYFYYNIPILLNCALVFRFLSTDVLDAFWEKERLAEKAVLVCAVYFAVFSNLFGSIVLFGYCCVEVLSGFFRMLREKQSFGAFLKGRAAHLAIGVLWFFSAMLELQGDRAGAVEQSNLWYNILEVCGNLRASLSAVNKPCLLLCLLLFAAYLALAAGKKKQGSAPAGLLPRCLGCALVILLLLVVLCAASERLYIMRAYVQLAVWAFVLAAAVLCLQALVGRFDRLTLALPLLLCVLVSLTNTNLRTFADCNVLYLTGEQCIAVGEDLIAQAQDAEAAGETELELKVIDAGSGDNWPHTTYLGDRFADTLFKHGLTNRRLSITAVPSGEINEKYAIGALGRNAE